MLCLRSEIHNKIYLGLKLSLAATECTLGLCGWFSPPAPFAEWAGISCLNAVLLSLSDLPIQATLSFNYPAVYG